MSKFEYVSVYVSLLILLWMSTNLVDRVIKLEQVFTSFLEVKQETLTCDEIKAIYYKDDFFFSCLVVDDV